VTNWTPVQPLSDEPQGQAYWEPWTPKIGDRVRVRLSGECNVSGPVRETPSSPIVHGPGHPAYQNGIEGTVTFCDPKCTGGGAHATGHRVRVDYLHPSGWLHHGHFAACELEKIS
jgi:hypothetical protein